MIILLVFAFLAGIVTILSPCILPILPVILATSVTDENSKRRPYGIVVGFVLSFTFFTLFLTTLVKYLGIPADSLRTLSVIVIAGFGLSLLIPRFQLMMESLFSRLANLMPSSAGKTGFGGGMLIGLSLGLLWTPCVGPILASVISLALTGTVTSDAFFITLAYSLGTAIPMYLVIVLGRNLFTKVPWLLSNTGKIQKIFGLIMILVALAIYQGYDRNFQTYVLTKFPQYGAGLTQFEDKAFLKDDLKDMSKPDVKLKKVGVLASELKVGGEWFNSNPLTMKELKGKVVLVDFWTYTCINCIRTLPYLKNWHDKYNDKGLVIIGVHAPEFEFEKSADNVKKAITDFEIKYPVMQDNDFSTWRAYRNQYWPAKYLIDKDGNIRYTHFGEGEYDETELAIQELLAEAGTEISEVPNNQVTPTYGRTHETYLGSERSGNESYVTYSGKWNQSREYTNPAAGSKLRLEFNAKSVYLVMRNTGSPATVKVYVDGKAVKEIIVDKDMLYTLVDLDAPGRHILQLEFLDGNAELFAFTFG
jgi:cytochrome c biogenesis protein CcdA/thiol-disulfide isomerase/thioredoxin